jgi:hypothetical protein
MAFDVEGARKAGYSDAEIVDHLATERKFDAAGARKSGYSDAELLSHLREPLAPATPKPESSMLGSYARGVVNFLGVADEARAGTDALVQGVRNLAGGDGPSMGEAYDRSLAANRAQLAADADQHPVASIAGNVAGGVGSAILTAPLAAAAATSRVVAPVVGRLNTLLPAWVNTTARVAGGGAAGGGVAGFGEGEGGFVNRAGSGLVGAGLGAVAAPVASAAMAGPHWLGNRLSHAFGWRNADEAAERQILRSLDRGKVTLDDVETRLAAGGNAPLALVDAGSRNTVGLARTAANTPSEAMDVADAFVQGRRATRPDRLMNAGDAAFGGGSGEDVAQQLKALREKRSTGASPLYKQAFDERLVEENLPRAAPFVADPIGREAMQRGLRVLELEHLAREEKFDPADFGVRLAKKGEEVEDGVPAGRFVLLEGQEPNMRLLDAVKRGYDAVLDDFRDTKTGKIVPTQYTNAVDASRRTYVGVLDEANPVYGQARAAWGGPSAQLEAMDAGRKAFRTDRDIVAQRMTGAPEDVQDAYRLGAGRAFADQVSDPGRASNAARVMLENQQMQSRLNSLLPERLNTVPRADVLDAFNAVLRRERDMTAVERAVSPRAGSQTGQLAAGAEDMAIDPHGPVAQGLTLAAQLGTGNWMGAARTVGGSVVRRAQGINPATSDALANRLFQVDPVQRAAIVQQLRNRLMQDGADAAEAQRILRPIIRGLGTAAGMQAD